MGAPLTRPRAPLSSLAPKSIGRRERTERPRGTRLRVGPTLPRATPPSERSPTADEGTALELPHRKPARHDVKQDPPQAPRAPRGPADPQYMKYAGAGLQFALTFLACGALGWWLDGKLGTEPWLMIVGILAGAAGAMYSLVARLGGGAKRP